MTTTAYPASLDRLQRQWLWIALTWLAVWLAAYYFLLRPWSSAERWLLLSGAAFTAGWLYLRRQLKFNYRESAELLPALGPGNQISILRGSMLAFLAGFLFSTWPPGALVWLPAGLFTAVCILDGLDGYVARRTDQVTELGRRLDMEFDGFGVAVVTILGITYGQLPVWFLLVGFARYLFVAGLWLREHSGRPTYPLLPSIHRRIMAGMLMGMMTAFLWPIVPASMAHIAAVVIALPVLLGFVRDWLTVSGSLQADNERYLQVRRAGYLLVCRWLPLLWRFLLVAALSAILLSSDPWYRPTDWENVLRGWGLPGAPTLALAAAVVAFCCLPLIALGIAGRLMSLILIFPIGFDINAWGLILENGLALLCALLIAIYGTGLFSLWSPEEAILVPRGAKAAAVETAELSAT